MRLDAIGNPFCVSFGTSKSSKQKIYTLWYETVAVCGNEVLSLAAVRQHKLTDLNLWLKPCLIGSPSWVSDFRIVISHKQEVKESQMDEWTSAVNTHQDFFFSSSGLFSGHVMLLLWKENVNTFILFVVQISFEGCNFLSDLKHRYLREHGRLALLFWENASYWTYKQASAYLSSSSCSVHKFRRNWHSSFICEVRKNLPRTSQPGNQSHNLQFEIDKNNKFWFYWPYCSLLIREPQLFRTDADVLTLP